MQSRALILDGRIEDDPMAAQCRRVVDAWLSDRGWSTTTFTLRDTAVAPCAGCFGCWIQTPGECVIPDAGRDIARIMANADAMICLTPIQFGGYSYELKRAVDRSIPNISPLFCKIGHDVHHRRRYAAYPSLIVIGWGKRVSDEEEDVFHDLVRRHAINMHAPRKVAAVLTPADEGTIERRVEWALAEGIRA